MRFLQSMTFLLGLSFLSVAPAAETPAKFEVGEFTFATPEGWKRSPSTSPLRKAELRLSRNDHEAEVIFFHFGPGQGGDAKANVERWLSQFQEPRAQLQPSVEEKTLERQRITYVYAQGTYLSGPPLGAKTALPDHALLGAILDSREGNVYIRMTGPIELVKEARPKFEAMIEAAARRE